MSRTPTTLGDYPLAVRVTDANSWTTRKSCTLNIENTDLNTPVVLR